MPFGRIDGWSNEGSARPRHGLLEGVVVLIVREGARLVAASTCEHGTQRR